MIDSFLYLQEDKDDQLKKEKAHLTQCPPISAMVGMTSTQGFSYLVDICFFPVTCSLGFYRVWVIGETKYGTAQGVQICVTEPAAVQAQLELSMCFQLCSHTYSPIEKFVMLYLPKNS